MEQQRQFRLHVAGLGPSITPQDIEKRLGAFGKVLKIDGVGKLDGNGIPLKYAFVDISSTTSEIIRCMNLLSGTIYKGNTLRIAPARPDYLARAEREKANLPIHSFVDRDEEELQAREKKAAQRRESKLMKSRGRRKGIDGFESSKMEVMTVKKFKSRQGVNGWKKDPETSLPIFPIITRPLRPLPPLDSPQSEPADQEGPLSIKVLTRARRTRIDPTSYRAAIKNRKAHILGPRAISIEQYKLGFISGAKDVRKSQLTRPMWQCQVLDGGQVVWSLQNGNQAAQEERMLLSDFTLKQMKEANRISVSPVRSQFSGNYDPCLPRQPISQLQRSSSVSCSSGHQPHQSDLGPIHRSSIGSHSGPAQQLDHCLITKRSTSHTAASFPTKDAQMFFEPVSSHHNGDSTAARVDQSSRTHPAMSLSSENLLSHYGPEGLRSPPNSGALRLRGGASSKPGKAPKKRLKSSKHLANALSESAVADSSSSCDARLDEEDLAMASRKERQQYMSWAYQTVNRTEDKSQVLEGVGEGYQAAVERQKAKEQKQGLVFEDTIELVPPSLQTQDERPPHKFTSLAGCPISLEETATRKPSKDASVSDNFDNESSDFEAPLQPQNSRLVATDDEIPLEFDRLSEQSTSHGMATLSPIGAKPVGGSERNHRSIVTTQFQTEGTRCSDIQLLNLTDIFKAKEDEKTGFRLTDALLGIELDDDMLTPNVPPEATKTSTSRDLPISLVEKGNSTKLGAFTHPSRLNSGSFLPPKNSSQLKDGQIKRTFFCPFHEDFDGMEINALLSPEQRNKGRQSWLSGSLPPSHNWRTFVRTESIAEIEEAHTEKKLKLTEHLRRKHKDAAKRERKWSNKRVAKPSSFKDSEVESNASS